MSGLDFLHAFLPELVLCLGILLLFVVTLGERRDRLARRVAGGVALAVLAASFASLGQEAVLLSEAYRVDAFSQWLKLAFAAGYLCVVLLGGDVEDIRADIRPEYQLLLSLSILGLLLVVSCVELIALVVSLELSSFPLFLLVAMRRERAGQRSQMESAMKYMMFGVAANGVMFFGMSYLFGLTGTTLLPQMAASLGPMLADEHMLAVAGVALTMAGLLYKLAVFPFHFWTPDVYQGAANVTAATVASLPKLAAVAVLARVASAAVPGNAVLAALLSVLAVASMLYGNLAALVQRDFKRLLGFSGIAHAGYALIGLVAMDARGIAASLYYMSGYILMVLACFVVIARVSRDGANLDIGELAGLHRRAPLLAATLLVGVFALAGLPPFVGFMGKLTLLAAAWSDGHHMLVVLAAVNAAVAVYYYLRVIKEALFTDAAPAGALVIDLSTRVLCVALMAGILVLGVKPAMVIDGIAQSLAWIGPVAAVAR